MNLIAITCAAVIASAASLAGQTPESSLAQVTAVPTADRFALSAGGHSAALIVDARDYVGVRRAAGSFRDDVARVSGAAPELLTDAAAAGGKVVLIGTIGRSAFIDDLIKRRKLDVTGVAGRWESFVRQVVDQPLPGVEQALVIAGSDKRGTIYGIYDLSQQIGVSPWSWWADVPVPHQDELHVLSYRYSLGEPAVKYRGFFINDEAPALSGWTSEKFGGFNHQFYERVFQLLLRMKGNFLWPAMWGNAFYDDDPENPRLADEYGVVIGTSHHEPLMRAHDEWRRYGKGAWNYQTNEAVLKEFWRGSIKRMGSYESLVTVGMRGDGDMPMSQQSNIALLEKIVADQRQIISEVSGKEASATPQVWALYKEVQDYYDRGMRVPEDVTLLFADDNWGNIRRLPLHDAAPRAGGYGVYYHFDYVGGPRNYKWINTNQIERVQEQMSLAYQHGVDRIWIVNVGDIKPMEYPLQFFLDFAWNPRAWPAERLPEYTRVWAGRQFGSARAEQIAELLNQYTKYNSRRKPELLSPETYELTNYREWERVASEYNQFATRADSIYATLPGEYRDAFYQLVLYPVKASANINDLYGTVALNRMYAAEGRARTNELADRAEELFANDARMSAFYNDTLAGGKWSHMMDQTRIGYTYWQQPPKDVMPAVKRIELPAGAELGVAIEGSDQWWPSLSAPATLPQFDAFARQSYYIDVFNRGRTSFEFSARSKAAWLKVTPSKGRVAAQERLTVSVDWARAPRGVTTAPITIAGAGKQVVVQVNLRNPANADAIQGFIESNGYVSIEAHHYDRAVNDGIVRWVTIPNLGRTSSSVEAQPMTVGIAKITATSPHLEYRFDLDAHDSVRIHAYASPTLDFNDRKGLRYGISIDDETPQIVNLIPDTTLRAWERAVANNIRVGVSTHAVKVGQHTLKFWLVDPGVVLQKLVIDAGGLKPSYLGPPESTRRDARQVARFDWFEYQGSDPVYEMLKAADDTYLNPVLPGFYPDPSIARAGDDYYLVTSTFSYYPGVPIFHSRDLVNWTQIGNVLERSTQLPVDGLGVSRGVFAPTIRYHDDTFYMITTLADAGGNMLVTAKDPAGPWSDPVWLHFDGIDPSLFFDDDGRVYIINNGPPIGRPLYPGHRALWVQEYDPGAKRMIGERKLVVDGGVDITKKPIWIEAPHIIKTTGSGEDSQTGSANAWYYLIAAEGGTAEQHSEVVFRSKSVWGPWQPYAGNPILTQRQLDQERPFPITSAGHADFVRTQNGEWWAVFLATRPYVGDRYNTGRETFMLPVQWRDGWPHILTGDATVPYVLKRPDLPLQPDALAMKSGNFVERDEFDEAKLPLYWSFLRTVREQWHDLDSQPGWLTIEARPQPIGKRAQPSFVARRQQHAHATFTTAMRFVPQRVGDRAGLVAFQNDDFYYLFGVTLAGGKPVVQLEKSRGANGSGEADVIASAPLTLATGQTIYLKIAAHGTTYDFSYALRPGEWQLLKSGVDATWLSTKVAQGFVGVMVGMYAYAEDVPPAPISPTSVPRSSERWVGTWGTSPQLVEPANMPPAPGLAGNTLRQIVRVSIGGSRLRVRLSNEFGNAPLTVNVIRIARSMNDGAIDSASSRTLTFSGDTTVTLAVGSAAVSDAFDFAIQPRTDAAITIHFGSVPSALTGHPGSRTTSYLQTGSATSAASLPDAVKTVHWYVITGIDVVSERGAAVVTLGNSITDGRGSTTDQQNRWPDQLAARLQANRRTAHLAVLNQGIGGNCVVHTCLGPAALQRFERDVLGQSSARWLIILEGVNDIGRVKTPEEATDVAQKLIAAYQELVDRAHARAMRVYGATIMPFGGSFYDRPESESARQTVNAWIRTSKKFDTVIDTDAALRDPAQPNRLLPAADTGDHLHPNELGHRMIAEAVNLALFEK